MLYLLNAVLLMNSLFRYSIQSNYRATHCLISTLTDSEIRNVPEQCEGNSLRPILGEKTDARTSRQWPASLEKESVNYKQQSAVEIHECCCN